MIRETCVRCGGINTYKNGGNFSKSGQFIQRYYCRDCQKTFVPKKKEKENEK
ncbi:MAG: IS1/IS1595 family N-terminal zinc-binding domain-containing protein [Microcoleaceae cyanobacterium]